MSEQQGGSKWEQLRARRLADPAAQARYAHTRDALIAVRRVLLEIERERERRGLSKAALAQLVGMQPAAVRRLLTAAGSNPTLRTVIGVADALGFEVELRPKPASAGDPVPGRRAGRARTVRARR